jgi:hypothetical protein
MNILPSKVIVVHLRGISVEVLLSAHEVFSIVKVESVILVTVRGSNVPG